MSPAPPAPDLPPALPEKIGCVGCGREVWAEQAVWAQCGACGKTCGYCQACVYPTFFPYVRYPNDTTTRLAQRFVDQSVEWHEERVHLFPPRWVRRKLLTMPRSGPVELF